MAQRVQLFPCLLDYVAGNFAAMTSPQAVARAATIAVPLRDCMVKQGWPEGMYWTSSGDEGR